MDEAPRRGPLSLAVAALALGALALNAARYFPFQVDDTFIALQYSRRLLDGAGLTWTDGLQPAGGFTSLLWVLVVAAMGAVGVELETASRALGLFGAALACLSPLLAWPPEERGPLPAATGALLVALSGSVGAWSVGGLEGTLLMGFFGVGLAAALRGRLLLAGACLATATWVRPDAPLLVAGVGFGMLLAGQLRAEAWGQMLRVAALPVLAWLAQGLVFTSLFGEPVPNTAHAKLEPGAYSLSVGFDYVAFGLTTGLKWAALLALGVVVACVPMAWRAVRSRLLRAPAPTPDLLRRALLIGAPLLLWTSYVALVGGDFMPARRHLLPTTLGLAFLGAEAVSRLPRWASWLALPLLGLHAHAQLDDVANRMAYAQRDGSKRAEASRLMGQLFGRYQPRVAVEAAGALPYYAQLPALDMLGLNDWHIARQPPLEARAPVGHGLGDPDYVIAQAPDMVVFCGMPPSGAPCWPAGKGLVKHPGWVDYELVVIESGARSLPVWVRRDSAKIGAHWVDAETLRAPPWLFEGGEVWADAGGLELRAGVEAATLEVALPAGRWGVEGAVFSNGERELDVPEAGEVALRVPAGATLEGWVDLRRIGDARAGEGGARDSGEE